MLVEVALGLRPRTVLDVGTGSGAIALAIADELPEASVIATDTSPAALGVAAANAGRLGLADRVRFEVGTLPQGQRAVDLVVANLPYVAEGDWRTLQPEIKEFEPREALVSGADGLDAIRGLLSDRPECKAIALEVGEGQAAEVDALVKAAGFWITERRRDLAGIERVVVGVASAKSSRSSAMARSERARPSSDALTGEGWFSSPPMASTGWAAIRSARRRSTAFTRSRVATTANRPRFSTSRR